MIRARAIESISSTMDFRAGIMDDPTSAASSVEVTDAPSIEGVHHISFTVTDVDASVAWYKELFGLDDSGIERHWGNPEGGYAAILHDPRSGLYIGIDTHKINHGERFNEAVTGLDHICFQV